MIILLRIHVRLFQLIRDHCIISASLDRILLFQRLSYSRNISAIRSGCSASFSLIIGPDHTRKKFTLLARKMLRSNSDSRSPLVLTAAIIRPPQSKILLRTPANAGARDESVLSDGSGSSAVFEGGFAGECPDGQYWTYVDQDGINEWRCSGDIGWEQPVLLPQTSEGDLIGMVLPNTNFMTEDQIEDLFVQEGFEDFSNYRLAVPEGDDGNWGGLQDVEMTCYDASLSEVQDGNYDNSYSASTSISIGQTESVGMYVDMSSEDDFDGAYSCNWSYEAENRPDRLQNIGELVEMHNDDSDVINEHFEFYEGLERGYNNFDEFNVTVVEDNEFQMMEGQ